MTDTRSEPGGLKIKQADSMPVEKDETVTRAAEMHG